MKTLSHMFSDIFWHDSFYDTNWDIHIFDPMISRSNQTYFQLFSTELTKSFVTFGTSNWWHCHGFLRFPLAPSVPCTSGDLGRLPVPRGRGGTFPLTGTVNTTSTILSTVGYKPRCIERNIFVVHIFFMWTVHNKYMSKKRTTGFFPSHWISQDVAQHLPRGWRQALRHLEGPWKTGSTWAAEKTVWRRG